MKKWLSRLTKISFFIFAFIAVIITVLFNMGGNSDTLKGAIEDYIGQSSGFAAKIQDFQKMTFFPNISVEMKNILLERPDPVAMRAWAEAEKEKPQEEQGQTPPPISFYQPDGAIDYFKVSVGFWDVSFGRARKIRDIQVRNAHFRAGSISHKEVVLKTLSIDETPKGEPFLYLDGYWGKEAFEASMQLERAGSRYMLGEESEFEAEVGKISAQGILRPRTMGGVHIRDFILHHNELQVLETTFSLIRNNDGMVDVKGDFLITENGSNGTFDWKLNPRGGKKILGSVEAETIHPNDFNEESKLSLAWQEWNSIFLNPERKTEDSDNISITIKDYQGAPFSGRADIGENQFIFTEQ